MSRSRTVFRTVALGIFCILLLSAGQTSLKYGLLRVGGVSLLEAPAAAIGKVFSTPYIVLGFIIYAISAVLWLDVLSRLDFSFAFPLVSLTYVFSLFIGRWVFGEQVNASRVLGVLLICAGLFFIIRSRS